MIKNYIILAHKNPQQIHRLIHVLQDGNSYFHIHIDLNSDIKKFALLNDIPKVSLLTERVKCIWGDFSIIRATLLLIRNVIKSGHEGFTILLSGQDYPIKSNKTINAFLNENIDFNFIDIMNIHDKWNKKMIKDKIQHYHFLHSEKRGDSNSYAPFFHSDTFNQIRTIFHLLKGRLSYSNFIKTTKLPKRQPVFHQQYAGSQWWAMNNKTLRYLQKFIDDNYLTLENYYSQTSAPDEIFFQSVLMHLAKEKNFIKVKPALTYVNWKRKDCILPVTFTKDDLNELLFQNSKLFARKFDTDLDENILNHLDKQRLNAS